MRAGAASPRSAWDKGVKKYAEELLCNLDEYHDRENICNEKLLSKALLNGADNWSKYSWGGCSLVCNADIAERLCNPTELKRTKGGTRKPNSREEWLDAQARALCQADRLIRKIYREMEEINEIGKRCEAYRKIKESRNEY